MYHLLDEHYSPEFCSFQGRVSRGLRGIGNETNPLADSLPCAAHEDEIEMKMMLAAKPDNLNVQ